MEVTKGNGQCLGARCLLNKAISIRCEAHVLNNQALEGFNQLNNK
jgi:hypothetical protein